jgi:GTP cyclohydrolase IA
MIAAVRPLKRLRQQQRDEAADASESAVAVATSAAAASSGGAGDDMQHRRSNHVVDHRKQDDDDKVKTMTRACRTILECIGEDPSREGLQKTPERWAKALMYMCQGYQQSPADVTNEAVFQENHNEMVVVRNIDIHSLWYVIRVMNVHDVVVVVVVIVAFYGIADLRHHSLPAYHGLEQQ